MPEILTDINSYYIAAVGAVFGIFLFVSIAASIRHSRRKKRAAAAAETFKSKVLSELEGVYPVPRYLEPEACDRFRESIPGIESAAAEFRQFISPERRKAFDSALKKLCNHCRTIRWEACMTFNIKPGEGKPEDEGPKEIFRQNVNALLAFAKKP